MNAAAALSRTTSRRGPASPPARIDSTIAAFSAGVPPTSAETGASTRPRSRATTSWRVTPVGPDVVENAAAVERQLVETVAVDDQRSFGAEEPQHLGELRSGRRGADAENLPASARRGSSGGRAG